MATLIEATSSTLSFCHFFLCFVRCGLCSSAGNVMHAYTRLQMVVLPQCSREETACVHCFEFVQAEARAMKSSGERERGEGKRQSDE